MLKELGLTFMALLTVTAVCCIMGVILVLADLVLDIIKTKIHNGKSKKIEPDVVVIPKSYYDFDRMECLRVTSREAK